MRMSLLRLYWLKIGGSLLALVLAVLYLYDFTKISLAGFGLMAIVIAILTTRLLKSTLTAFCDLCGADATMTVEYGAVYSSARLILNCSRCGRIINSQPGSMHPQKEKP